MNRGVEGDTVVVRLLPRAQWGSAERLGGRDASGRRRRGGGGAAVGSGAGGDGAGAAGGGDQEEEEEDDDDLVQTDRLDGAQVVPEMGADTAEPAMRGGGGGARPSGVVVGIVRRETRPAHTPCMHTPLRETLPRLFRDSSETLPRIPS